MKNSQDLTINHLLPSTVSVVLFSHNNTPRQIDKCLNSILNQTSSHPIRITVIHCDRLGDETDIFQEYAALYPDRIRFIAIAHRSYRLLQTNREITLEGQFFITCSEKDIWNDPNMIQHQVDFLASHSGYSICFQSPDVEDETIEAYEMDFETERLDMEELLYRYSVLFKTKENPVRIPFDLIERLEAKLFIPRIAEGKTKGLKIKPGKKNQNGPIYLSKPRKLFHYYYQ